MPFSALDIMQCINDMNTHEHVMSVAKSVGIKFNVRLYYLPQDQWTSGVCVGGVFVCGGVCARARVCVCVTNAHQLAASPKDAPNLPVIP
jgi:hypothetical protein